MKKYIFLSLIGLFTAHCTNVDYFPQSLKEITETSKNLERLYTKILDVYKNKKYKTLIQKGLTDGSSYTLKEILEKTGLQGLLP